MLERRSHINPPHEIGELNIKNKIGIGIITIVISPISFNLLDTKNKTRRIIKIQDDKYKIGITIPSFIFLTHM
jgi:hypothetical protein